MHFDKGCCLWLGVCILHYSRGAIHIVVIIDFYHLYFIVPGYVSKVP